MRGGKGAGEGKRMRTRKKMDGLRGKGGGGREAHRTRKKTDGLRDFIFSMHYSSLVQVYQLQTVIL